MRFSSSGFQEGAIKVYAGTTGSAQAVVVDDYLTQRRAFQVNGVNDGKPVHCSILREVSFEDGGVERLQEVGVELSQLRGVLRQILPARQDLGLSDTDIALFTEVEDE